MSDGVEVRTAREDEYAAVGELTLDGYVHDGFLTRETDYAEHLLDAAHRAVDAELVVAVDANGLLGTVTFCPPGSPLRELSQDGEAEFRMLAVAPSARGRGVGRDVVAVQRLHGVFLQPPDAVVAADHHDGELVPHQ